MPQGEETLSLARTMANGVGRTRAGGTVVVGQRAVVAVARASRGREGDRSHMGGRGMGKTFLL